VAEFTEPHEFPSWGSAKATIPPRRIKNPAIEAILSVTASVVACSREGFHLALMRSRRGLGLLAPVLVTLQDLQDFGPRIRYFLVREVELDDLLTFRRHKLDHRRLIALVVIGEEEWECEQRRFCPPRRRRPWLSPDLLKSALRHRA
jgi:hypothetical protein